VTARSIAAAAIAEFLGRPLRGTPSPIFRPSQLDLCGPGDIVWIRSFTPERVALVETRRPALVICDAGTADRLTVPHVVCDRPRLAFIRVTAAFFAEDEPIGIHPTALIDAGATLGEDVSVGAYTRIGAGVRIGAGCRIASGVSLEGQVRLGRRCRIKANSVIGAPGFGFERDEQGVPIHFPHLGDVVLEDDVWLGACTTIERAALGTTRLCQGVKVDDLVQIGHNVVLGRNTLVMSNAVICGGTVVGERCWIAPNSVIKEKLRIGDDVTVALGAVVLKNVEPGQVVAGVPAKPLAR